MAIMQADLVQPFIDSGGPLAGVVVLLLIGIGWIAKVVRDDYKERWRQDREDRLARESLDREIRRQEFEASQHRQDRWYQQIDSMNTRIDKAYLILALVHPEQALAIEQAYPSQGKKEH